MSFPRLLSRCHRHLGRAVTSRRPLEVIRARLTTSATSRDEATPPPPQQTFKAALVGQLTFDPNLDPTQFHDYFGVHKLFNVKDLFEARVHLGHTPTSVTPQMAQFVYGTRFDTTIIDLDQTALLLRQALNFTAHIAAKGGVILFVGRQSHYTHLIERCALESGEYSHCRKWDSRLFMDPNASFGGHIRLPDLIVLLHTKDGTRYEDHQIIQDAGKSGIPTVGIVDTDCFPNIVTYPVPGNDDSLEAIQLYLHLFKQVILIGKKYKAQMAAHAEETERKLRLSRATKSQ